MKIRRTFLGIVPLLATLLTSDILLAQASPWADIVAAAKKEGSVQLYSTQTPDSVARLTAAFNKKYPEIRVDYARTTTTALITKIEQERISNADGGDVAVHADLFWFLDQIAGSRLIPPAGPSAKDWPAKGLKSGILVLVAIDPLGLAYNTQRVTTSFATGADLLKPELKGKVGMSDIISPNVIALYDAFEARHGSDFLTKLKEQNPRLYTGSFPGAQSVASGEVYVSAYTVPGAVLPLSSKGAPIKFVSGDVGAAVWGGVPKWSKRPNAGQLFLDFMMSREGQEALHSQGESASVLPDIKGAAPYVEPYDGSKYTAEYLAKYRERWSKLFK